MNDDHEIKEKEIIMLHIPFIIIKLIKKTCRLQKELFNYCINDKKKSG